MFSWFKKRKLRNDLKEVLADGRIDSDELARLRARSVELGLNNDELAEVVGAKLRAEIASIRNRIEKTRRFSPDDEAQMLEAAKRFSITLNFDDLYMRFRQLWLAEQGLPLSPRPVEASCVLRSGEQCYFSAPSVWKRLKTIKHRTGSSGNNVSIRIMKGWSYRVSSMKPSFREEEVLAPQAAGSLSITNKRIIFEGDKKSTTINIKDVIDLELYADCIEVKKTRGNHEFFTLDRPDVEYSSLMIAHFMN